MVIYAKKSVFRGIQKILFVNPAIVIVKNVMEINKIIVLAVL